MMSHPATDYHHMYMSLKRHMGRIEKPYPLPFPFSSVRLTMGGDHALLSVTRLTFLTERNVFRSIASHSWTGETVF